MNELICSINELKKSETARLIDSRICEFTTLSDIGKKDFNEIFKELCFCILTANFQAEKSIKIQKEIDDGFLTWDEQKLAGKLRELGHRFPNMRAKFIVEARQHIAEMKRLLKSGKSEKEKRDWLAKNIKGLGMKEASHFLRNVGYKNLAILDFHIIDILAEHRIIEELRSKTGKEIRSLNPKTYVEIENKLEQLCDKTGLCQGELDFYLWYLETGKVMK